MLSMAQAKGTVLVGRLERLESGVPEGLHFKIETDREISVGSYEAWWDVPAAEVSGMDSVNRARDPSTKSN